jgi:hypothetical protein
MKTLYQQITGTVLETSYYMEGFEDLTATCIKNDCLWEDVPYSLVDTNRCYRGA